MGETDWQGNNPYMSDAKENQEIQRYVQDTKWRKFLCVWVMSVVSLWLIAVLILTFIYVLGQITTSHSVMIALLATTTVNILGLAYIVLKGIFLFKEREKERITLDI